MFSIIMNITVSMTHLITDIFILVYPLNVTLLRVKEANIFLTKKWMGKHMVDLNFNSDLLWRFNS